MASIPPTQPTLLVRIRNTYDHEAWSRFVDLYGPLVYGFLRKRGLQDADAVDLAQDVFRQITTAIQRLDYDGEKGSFRGWLLTIVQNRLLAHWRKKQERASGDTDALQMLHEIPQPGTLDESSEWDAEYERQLFHFASQTVKQDFTPATWAAFWQTAIEGRSGKDVAQGLEMTVAAVYLAKGRVMARLREQIKILAGEDSIKIPD